MQVQGLISDDDDGFKKKKGLHGAHTQLRCNGPQPRKGTKDPLQGLKRREQTAQKGENPTPMMDLLQRACQFRP
jgi:hypothetical protein